MHSALTPYVSSCVGYDDALPEEAVHHGLPSTSLTVIISFDEPLDCGWVGDSTSERFWVLGAGLHDRPALIRTHGHQHGMQLALTPLGARTLLGSPSAALANSMLDGSEVTKCIPGAVHAQLTDLDWRRRFDLLEAQLLSVIGDEQRQPADEVTHAWRLIVDHGGTLAVQDIAATVGWSRRHLSSRFRAEFGLTPKEASRVSRFGHARALFETGMRSADVAYRCGYADQAHLNREWQRLAGQTPRQTLAEFPIVQEPLTD